MPVRRVCAAPESGVRVRMSGGGGVGVERRVGKVARFGWGPVGLGATGLANGLSLE